MKMFVLVGFCILSTVKLHSQENLNKKNDFYLSTELQVGTYIGLDVNVNYILRNKYTFKLGYTGHIRKPKSEPDDFTSGIIKIIGLGAEGPFDQLSTIQATVGRLWKLNESGTIRLNMAAGAGYTIIKEPTNWERIDNAFLTFNYTYDFESKDIISVIINPKIEFAFSKYYGLTVSPMLLINSDRTYVGIGVGSMIGLVNNRINRR